MKRFRIQGVVWAVIIVAVGVFLLPKAFKRGIGSAENKKPAMPGKPSGDSQKLAAQPLAATSPSLVAQEPPRTPKFFPLLDDFSNWANQPPGERSARLAMGEDLAKKRRDIMLHLIQTDPEKALQLTAPARWRQELPASVTQYFEERIDARGDYGVMVSTDFEKQQSRVVREVVVGQKRYDAYVYGARVSQVTQMSAPIHGIAIDGKMAVSVDAVRILEPEEAAAIEKTEANALEQICGVSGRPADSRGQKVAADIGGRIVHFCGVDHCHLVNAQLAAAGNGDTAPGSSSSYDVGWSQGPKEVLFMRVNFPDDLTEPVSEADAYSRMNSVNTFYTEGSYNTTSLTPTVTPLLTLPQTKGWYATAGPAALLADARAASKAAGYDTANYDWDIAAFTSVPGYDFGGLAYVHGKGVWLQSVGVGVAAHELGHNYGLWHANSWDTSLNSSILGPGSHVEYGNIYDTMGRASAGNNQFNATHKNILHWIPDLYVHDIKTNGVYRLYPFDAPRKDLGHFLAAKIYRDFQRDYWLEFRQRFTSNPWLQSGVLVDWSPWSDSAGGTHLLDTTPDSPTSDDSKQDAALVIGRTFTDPTAGVSITPLARGLDGSNTWIDVRVNLGSFPSNRPPVAKIEIDPTNAAPGTLIHFHATATDPDGDPLAYAWTFDDQTFSTNNVEWATNVWAITGEHVVRCVISDMKGGVASANGLITIGSAVGYRITGRITDTNGIPLEGVRVDNGGTNIDTYLGGFTDSDGRYIITGASNSVNLTAVKYGFTNTPASTWNSPIFTSGPAIGGIDFAAMELTKVSIAASTNSVMENDGSSQLYTITRTGDTNSDLTVTLYVSGSADVTNDCNITAPVGGTNFVSGTNVITIPAGESSVACAFHVINDSSIEDPEMAVVTILDDTTYINGARSEAIITILDDDVAVKPLVSVGARTTEGDNTIFENNHDPSFFVFKRTGATPSDLTVFYSVSGLASPGSDYQPLLGVVIIPAGSSTVSVPLYIIDDLQVETNETVSVKVSANASYTADSGTTAITIIDDDVSTVTVTPTKANASEPNTTGRFTVMRAGDMTGNLAVHYTVGGTATSGLDYEPLSGTVTIPAGNASADITMTPKSDTLLEGDESVVVTLTNALGYNVGIPSNAKIYIHDQQMTVVSVNAADDTASEPGSDTGQFVISRGSVTSGDLRVDFGISGTALNGIDYVPIDDFIVIPDGSSSVTLDIIPFDDLFLEPDERVILTLNTSPNYTVGSQDTAAVTIMDDDGASVPAVGFTFVSSSVEERFSPGVSVSLSMTSAAPVTVDYKLVGGTAPKTRYAFADGTLTFNPGDYAVSIPLQIIDDNVSQPNATLKLVLVNPAGATLDGIKFHTYTIVDDDLARVSVSATADTAFEAGQVPGNFRISRSGPTTSNLLVNFQITGTASAPTDYMPIGSSVMIPVGQAFVDVPVKPMNDSNAERNETVFMRLTGAPGATIVNPASAQVLIVENDTNTLPSVVLTSTNKPYAVEGGAGGEFVFTRSGPTTSPLTVNYTIGGAASNGVDYATIQSSITIPAGQGSMILPVTPIDDTAVEGEETVILSLTADSAYQTPARAFAIVTIQDNDQAVRVDASDFEAQEPGINQGEFTFTRFGATNTPLQVFFNVSGTASNGVDYAALSNSFLIPAGQWSAKLPVVPLDDPIPEPRETVILTLSANPAYQFNGPSNATVYILDDEPMVNVVATLTNASENGLSNGLIKVYRGGNTNYDFTAHIAISGTATFGVDYPAFETNIYFCCGVTNIDIYIAPTNDLMEESVETVVATVLPDSIYTLGEFTNATVYIEDLGTNEFPVLEITSPSVPVVFLTIPVTNAYLTNANLILESMATNVDPSAFLTWSWTNVSGPGQVMFGDMTASNTTATFTNTGVYVLELTVSDGILQSTKRLTVAVNATNVLEPDLLHWTFDDGAGTNAVDASGAGNGGVVLGTTNWQTNGVIGGSLEFPGGGASVAQSTSTNLLNGLKAVTVSMWVRPGATNVDVGFFSGNGTPGTNATIGLRYKPQDARSLGTNVIEAMVSTSVGDSRFVTANNYLTNDWQHLAVTWQTGGRAELYINGHPSAFAFPSLLMAGMVTNCMQVIAGAGPGDTTNTWYGALDDVRVFSRALDAGEVSVLALLNPTNLAPMPDAGPDYTLQLTGAGAPISGVVLDDGNPNPPGALSNFWTMSGGFGTVTFLDPNSLTNSAFFSSPGDYVLRLISDDGEVKVYDEVKLTVTDPVTVYASPSDGDAAELGPDAGQFVISRTGDTTADLPLSLVFSGTASNGMDFLRVTNTVVIPADQYQVTIDIVPYLDDRTEGDETVILTVVTNTAYSLGSDTATVTIHDSPYGVWTVNNFTLEQLTDPTLSGEVADFDHDGAINFLEYAFNRDPKVAETNANFTYAVQTDPIDSKPHITVTYHRRVQPTDITYAFSVSGNLTTWNTGTNFVHDLNVTPDANGITETVKSEIDAPYTTSTNQFFTIRVQRVLQ